MASTHLFRDFVDRIQRIESSHEKGFQFERLLVSALPRIPSSSVREAYRWVDLHPEDKQHLFDDDSAKDNGVDIVVKTNNGEWIAVQAKCWTNAVSTADVDKFLAYCANLDNLHWRWIVTTGGWSLNIDKKMGVGRKASIINAVNEWGEFNLTDGIPKHQPAKVQIDAIDACVKGLRDYDKGRLTMACGSGKTLVSLKVAEELFPHGGRVLYATSGIGLVAQTRREWLNQGSDSMTSVVVCSDKDAGKQNDNALKTGEQTAPVTTDPSIISNKMNEIGGGGHSSCIFNLPLNSAYS